MKILNKIFLLLLVFMTSFSLNAQLIRPFTQRTSPFNPGVSIYNLKGDFTMIGNTNLTLQNYSDNSGNQNAMVYVDVDNNPGTLNSSSADLNFSTENGAVPACSEVVYAGLYWTGRAHNGTNSPNVFSVTKNGVTVNFDKQKIKLKGPSSPAYTDIIATTTDIYYPQTGDGYMYSAYAEVTDYVRNNGVLGTYTVADIALAEGLGGGTGYYGGWGLVVIYSNNNMKLRDITVFDGHAYVAGGITADFTIPLSGFNSTQTGPVNLKMGMIAGEGDRTISGDYFQIRNAANTAWVDLAHGGNATTNFFNSSVFTGGNNRNPNLLNNTGLDISMFNIPNANNSIIANNQNSTTFRYGSNQDTYIIFGIVFSVDSYEPEIEGLNTLTQINGTPVTASPVVLPGQTLTYELDIRNTGTEDIVNGQIIIPIPYNANYSASSGQYFFTPNSGTAPYFDPTMGGNGSIVWNIGNLPMQANPRTVLGTLTYTLTATTECVILNNANCIEQITVVGNILGTGATTNTSLNEPFITGYQQTGNCAGQPINDPVTIPIDAGAFVQANCNEVQTSYNFIFCNLDGAPTIAASEISGSFPLGTRFFNTRPVTTSSIEYTNTGFPAIEGTTTYYAYPQGTNSQCYIELTITVILAPIASTPTAQDQTYCLNQTAQPLTATASNPNYDLYYYTSATGGTATGQIIPGTSVGGITTYYVAEAASNTCVSNIRVPINVTVYQPGQSTLSGINGTNNYQTTATVGQQMCFDILSSNPQNGQVLGLTYNNGVQGATFTTAGSPFPTGTFCWTPTAGDVGTHTFTVVVNDNCGGTNTYTYTIVVEQVQNPCQVVVALDAVNDLVCSGNDGSAVVVATGGTAPYTFTVVNNTTGQIFTNTTGIFTTLTPGTYSVIVSDAQGCQPDCSNLSFTISGNVTPINSSVISTNVLCSEPGSTGGTITVSATGGTAPYLYSIGNGFVSSDIFNGLASGTYQVVVMDANGCSSSSTAVISAPAPLTASVINITQALCGNSNGSFEVVVTGGTAPYTYTVNGSVVNSGQIGGLAAGTYQVVVTDANNCTANTTAVISAPAPLTASTINIAQALCGNSNGSFEVVVTGGTAPYTYTLNGAASNSNIFNGLAAGTYQVVVTDANNCTDNVSAIITTPAPLAASVSNITQALCGNDNGSFVVVVTGGTAPYTYTLNGNAANNNTFSGLAAGTYQVVVTDANNCTAIVSATITAPAPLTASAINIKQALCGNSNGGFEVTVNGGTAPYTYSLNGLPATNNVFNGLAAGTYQVLVTDANNCTTNVSATITSPDPLVASVNNVTQALCGVDNGGFDVIVSGGTAPYVYTLNGTTVNSNTFSGLAVGTYQVVVTDANNCTAIATAFITSPAPLVSTIANVTQATCGRFNGTITVNVSGGSAPYSYNIGNGNVNSGQFANLAPGTYNITVTDANNCSSVVSATVTAPDPLLANATNIVQPSCGLNNGSFEVQVSGGVAPYTYMINGMGSFVNTFSGLGNGVYNVIVRDANGCKVTVVVTLQGTPAFAIRTGSTPVTCHGDCNGTAFVTGTTTPLSFIWSNGAVSSNISGLCGGTYSVTATDANGCQQVANTTVAEPDQLLVSLSSSVNESCVGNDGSATITATGGTAPYTFGLAGVNQTSTTTNSTGVFIRLTAGTYAYFITDANGCAQECIGQFSLIRDCVANNPGGSRRPAIAERTDYLLVNVNKTATAAKVNWSAKTDSRLSLTILDSNGKQISEQILGTSIGSMDLNVTSLLSNNYFVVLKDQNGNVISTNRMKITR